jgi:tripartite-type tricarboxylate transporter receptor subunit TctC
MRACVMNVEKTFCARSAVLPAIATLIAGAAPVQATGAEYPYKPIRIVIGYSAGGPADVSTRAISQTLGQDWKQQIIVDNRPSAGGILGAQMVAGATADGYTLLSVTASHAVAPAIYSKLPYDTVKDFSGITTTINTPSVLVVTPSLGAKTVKELLVLAKAKPGQLLFSSGGVGSATHFVAELFNSVAGISAVHVPYKGNPEALTDVVTGSIQYNMAPVPNAVALAKDGKIVALGVSSSNRLSTLPDLPTIGESGLPGFLWGTWFGWLAPVKTPRALIVKLNSEISRVAGLPAMRERWAVFGGEPMHMTPEQFDRHIVEQIALFTKLAKAANIKAD